MTSITAVSAPGKVLLAGGYLVLDRRHTGLTFGLDARIHIVIQHQERENTQIVVCSPQFQDAVWRYNFDSTLHLRDAGAASNPFVQTALQYALSYVGARCGQEKLSLPWSITILADNDYYSYPTSRPGEVSDTSTRSRFHQFNAPITKVNKTGLGSSAALVTALTSAVLEFCFSRNPPARPEKRELQERLHRLAQLAHCAAQGKVGSGFDVASAVYGSCIYRRFTPSIPERIGSHDEPGFAERLVELVEDDQVWDYEINAHRKVAIPKGLRLVMCDVDCGSQTPGMVKQVLKWRADSQATADSLWSELQQRNDELADRLQTLSEGEQDKNHLRLKSSISQIRDLLRKMTLAAKVPIEPDEQTALLDACSGLPGIIGGVVPGAGGYDAITLLVEDDQKVLDDLRRLFEEWKFGAAGGKVRLLGTCGEMEGTRVEDVANYEEWL